MAGKYQAYLEYKESGNKWFGSIPINWGLAALRRSLLEHKQGYYTTENYVDDGVKLLRITDLRDYGEIDISDCPKVSRADKSLVSFELKDGDVVFARTGGAGSFGVVKNLNERVVFASYLIRFRFCENIFINDYLRYMLIADSFQKAVKQNIHGGVTQNIHAEDIKNSYLAKPPIAEQQQIANFLDHETAKIDTLIEKQQQLIALLKEKRQAVISHAVTKGLNANAPMRDSGVDWLGEVPEHWGVKRLRYLGICQNGINIGAEFFGSGYPFVSYGDAYKNEVLPEYGSGLVQSTEQDRKVYSVVTGDVIFTRTSETVEEIGFSSTCLKTIKDASFAGFLIRFRPEHNVLDAGFSKYYFRNMLMRTFFIKEMNLVTRASLSQDLLKKLPVPLPPLDEQARIAEYIDEKSAVFEKLTENAETAIELMKERRTALISAAVTGKIDVRNWVAPEIN